MSYLCEIIDIGTNTADELWRLYNMANRRRHELETELQHWTAFLQDLRDKLEEIETRGENGEKNKIP